jgi:hypothetical protein
VGMFRSTRQRRIDRALSSVLDHIDYKHNAQLRALPDNHTWGDVNALTFARDGAVIAACKRADKLTQLWRARVERD